MLSLVCEQAMERTQRGREKRGFRSTPWCSRWKEGQQPHPEGRSERDMENPGLFLCRAQVLVGGN